MLNYPVGSQRTTLSDRNGPSCPSLSAFDYILYLLSAEKYVCMIDKHFFVVVLMSFGVFCCSFVWFVVIRWTSRDFLNINGGSIQV